MTYWLRFQSFVEKFGSIYKKIFLIINFTLILTFMSPNINSISQYKSHTRHC